MAVENAFIQMGFLLEQYVLDPLVEPMERAVLPWITSQWPQLTSATRAFLKDNRSPIATRLPLMNPSHVAALVAFYLLVVFVGRIVMSCREKMQPTFIANMHNLFMVWLSAYMCLKVLYEAFIVRSYSLFDNPRETNPDQSWSIAKAIWLFYFSKVFEFNDTYIMVVKKNFRQISFLHVYHHSSIFVIWWFVCYIAPYGEAYFSAALNSFIHVVMYGYYLCSSLNIARGLISRIKPYITMMQLTQFSLMMVQATYDVVIAKYFTSKEKQRMKYPIVLTTLLWFYMWTMLGLFANFFIQNYTRKPKSEKTKKQ